ncbi:MAG: hypothetical protein WBK55_02285 [Alphaproteobacteria bacterium]
MCDQLLTIPDAVTFIKSEFGLPMTEKQLRRAIEPRQGVRKLPFFNDPVTGRLVIRADTLKTIYDVARKKAEKPLA